MRTVLFTGDSITDAGQQFDPTRNGPGAGLGAGYVRRIAELAAAHADDMTIVNTGISGHRTTDLLARWDADVIDRRPDILTILVGVNDMWRRYDAGTPMSGAAFEANYSTLLDRARTELQLQRLVVMEPFLIPLTEEQTRWAGEDLDEKREISRMLASRFDATFLPLQSIMTDLAERDGPSSAVIDGVHPAAAGHELIAQTWWARVGSATS